MPYRELYRRRQREGIYLPRQWYVDDARQLQWVEGITLKATDVLSKEDLLGFIVKHNAGFMGGARDNYTIVVAGDLPLDVERFVVIKELMHCYFNLAEPEGSAMATDSAILLEALLRHFFGRSAESPSLQVRAEHQAFWMAMGVLCPEHVRMDWKDQLGTGVTLEDVARQLYIPPSLAELLLSDQYDDELRHLLA